MLAGDVPHGQDNPRPTERVTRRTFDKFAVFIAHIEVLLSGLIWEMFGFWLAAIGLPLSAASVSEPTRVVLEINVFVFYA
jgi:hypothetical protein